MDEHERRRRLDESTLHQLSAGSRLRRAVGFLLGDLAHGEASEWALRRTRDALAAADAAKAEFDALMVERSQGRAS